MPDLPVRLDLHNHTHHSADGSLSPRRLLELAAGRGLHCIAVTDHGTLRGGLECSVLAASDPRLPRVIPGMEIFTAGGEVIGLYLQEEVTSGLTVAETVARIRALGGIVYLPHPFDSIRRAAIEAAERDWAAREADIIEVRNGRMLLPLFNRRALELAVKLGKPMGAGSDAHYAGEVGRAYMEIAALPDRETLVELLQAGRPGRPLSRSREALAWVFHLRTGMTKTRAYLAKRIRPRG